MTKDILKLPNSKVVSPKKLWLDEGVIKYHDPECDMVPFCRTCVYLAGQSFGMVVKIRRRIFIHISTHYYKSVVERGFVVIQYPPLEVNLRKKKVQLVTKDVSISTTGASSPLQGHTFVISNETTRSDLFEVFEYSLSEDCWVGTGITGFFAKNIYKEFP